MQSLSYWEHETWLNHIDLLVIGSGIVGLNAAIKFKKLNPKAKVLVIERGILPNGASTKNAGFACFGSLTEILADLQKNSQDEVIALIQDRYEGLNLLRKMHGDQLISYEPCGGYELFTTEQEDVYQRCLNYMPELNYLLKEITQNATNFITVDQKLNDFKFKDVKHIILNQSEGAINTGQMMANLLKMAYENGVFVLNGISVDSIEENDQHVCLNINNKTTIKASKVLVATNGFASELLQLNDVTPGRTQVLVTEPIADLAIQGCFHYHEGYVYFRNIGNRILLGGGRHLAIEEETSFELKTTDQIQTYLEQLLSSVILPGKQIKIERRWSGILGLGETKRPILKSIGPRLFCAVRLGGMGVAIGTKLGSDAAELIASS